MRTLIFAFLLTLPHVAFAQNTACSALQELLFSYIETAQQVATTNQEIAQAAIVNGLTSDDNRLPEYIIPRAQANIEILMSAMNHAAEIVNESGCSRE